MRLGFEAKFSEISESLGTLRLTALSPSPVTGQKSALTTCLTTDSFGTHGNSGVKRFGEYA